MLTVMQFGGQHHAGLGVPAVGMALPGYVVQPQLGFGGSEMTWCAKTTLIEYNLLFYLAFILNIPDSCVLKYALTANWSY